MAEASQTTDRGVAEEMAAYIGIRAQAAQNGVFERDTNVLILMLSSDGFTASEIATHLDRAIEIARVH